MARSAYHMPEVIDMRGTDCASREGESRSESAREWNPCWLWRLRQPRGTRDEMEMRAHVHGLLDWWLTERWEAGQYAVSSRG